MRRARHRRPSRAALAAASTVPAVAAASMVLAGHSSAQAATLPQQGVVTTAQVQPMHFVKMVRPAAPVTVVTVSKGQYLSLIAERDCHAVADWTGIYIKNKHEIGSDPNYLKIHQRLVLDCRVAKYTPPPAPRLVAYSVPVHHHSYSAEASTESSGSYGSVNPGDYGGFQQCVITRESGGNSQVMNSSGHYGLYQFSESTWEAYGGSAADFGHASVAEQNRVFGNAMAQGGEDNWRPYDGC